MKKLLSLSNRVPAFMILISFILMSFSINFKEEVVIPSGTPIQFELINPVNSKFTFPGAILDFRVSNNVVIKGKTVILAGSVAKGQVVRSEKAKMVGQEGVIEVMVKSVRAVDGQDVPLFGGSMYKEGEDKQVLSIVAGLVCFPFGFLIKGSNAELPSGTSVSASVATSVTIELN